MKSYKRKESKMMKIGIIIFISVLTLVISDDDKGKYGNINLWRKTLCEKHGTNLDRDLQRCMVYDEPFFNANWRNCFRKIQPKAMGSFQTYQEMACKDPSIYHKVDDCTKKHKPARSVMNKPALNCFEKVLKKYHLNELLKKYFSHVN
ncbi:uncharacterized protein [Parasteatoda tepidariorum]|uniref:uncharacterized protein isoform X1 n=1 Tax=Parasteatoda tepidariorum TaxID=114398 RepID=UPI00077F98D8|nr:uncharacterized protein LOC107442340 isoform X1 [Parasteatoda tepidariorum]